MKEAQHKRDMVYDSLFWKFETRQNQSIGDSREVVAFGRRVELTGRKLWGGEGGLYLV